MQLITYIYSTDVQCCFQYLISSQSDTKKLKRILYLITKPIYMNFVMQTTDFPLQAPHFYTPKNSSAYSHYGITGPKASSTIIALLAHRAPLPLLCTCIAFIFLSLRKSLHAACFFSENGLKLTCGNVELHKVSGDKSKTPGPPI